MNDFYAHTLARGRKDALLCAIWLSLGERPGTLDDVTFGTLAEIAARYGVALTDSQVRKRVKEHEEEGIFEIVPRRERGRFDLYVYRLAPSFVPPAPKPEPETPLFDFYGAEVVNGKSVPVAPASTVAASPRENRRCRCGNGDGDGNGEKPRDDSNRVKTPEIKRLQSVSSVAAFAAVSEKSAQERININQEIKKESKRPFLCASISEFVVAAEESSAATRGCGAAFREKRRAGGQKFLAPEVASDESAPPVASVERSAERSAANVREYVDFSKPAVVALRREVARVVWERGVRPDFVDRLTAAIALRLPGLASLAELRALDREAAEEQTLYKVSKGFSGKAKRWQTTNLAARAVFEAAGYDYPGTRRGYEPRPDAERVASVDDESATERRPRAWTAADARLVEGFGVDELEKPLAETIKRVAKRDGIGGADAMNRAQLVRAALRRLDHLRDAAQMVGATG